MVLNYSNLHKWKKMLVRLFRNCRWEVGIAQYQDIELFIRIKIQNTNHLVS